MSLYVIKCGAGDQLRMYSHVTGELRPAMKKLRLAMDGLLKTARLTHSVFRLREDRKAAQRVCNVRYRRHVTFSQALTSLVTALMTRCVTLNHFVVIFSSYLHQYESVTTQLTNAGAYNVHRLIIILTQKITRQRLLMFDDGLLSKGEGIYMPFVQI